MKKYIFGLVFIVSLLVISPLAVMASYDYGITLPVEPVQPPPRPIYYPPVIMPNGVLPNGTVGTYYNNALQAQGGITPYTWSALFLNGVTLPPGLSISTNTKGDGVISGTPTTAGTYTFTITVTDANGTITTKSYTVKIVSVSATTPTLTLIKPNGGEQYYPGQQVTVKWTASGYGNVTPLIGLDLATCTSSGDNCSNTHLLPIYDLSNTGSKLISIPSSAPSSSNYKIRIYSYDSLNNPINNKADYSDEAFSIKPQTTSTSGTTTSSTTSGTVYGGTPASTTHSSTFGAPISSGIITGTTFSYGVSFGARSDYVKQLQNKLISLGFLAADSNTGFFGNGTKAALCKYQVSKGLILPSDIYCGYSLGPKTRAVLNS